MAGARTTKPVHAKKTKNTNRQLALRPETIRQLTGRELSLAAGGDPPNTDTTDPLTSAVFTRCPSQSCSYTPSCGCPNTTTNECTLATF